MMTGSSRLTGGLSSGRSAESRKRYCSLYASAWLTGIEESEDSRGDLVRLALDAAPREREQAVPVQRSVDRSSPVALEALTRGVVGAAVGLDDQVAVRPAEVDLPRSPAIHTR